MKECNEDGTIPEIVQTEEQLAYQFSEDVSSCPYKSADMTYNHLYLIFSTKHLGRALAAAILGHLCQEVLSFHQILSRNDPDAGHPCSFCDSCICDFSSGSWGAG